MNGKSLTYTGRISKQLEPLVGVLKLLFLKAFLVELLLSGNEN